MRIAVVGGGPGGLLFAILIRRADPSVQVTVFERNRADDTFGFGVVFSDRTLAGIDEADPVLREALTEHGRHWDDIEIRLKGERIRCGGNGMAAIARRTLLALMQRRVGDVGAEMRFSTEVTLDNLAGYDLVVAADGTGSKIRDELEQRGADLGVEVETASAKFIWLGTDYLFDGLTFVHERGPHGVFAVHGYPISADTSTFIVETDEASWRRAGLDEFDVTQPPGPSDLASRDYLEKLFADQIDGHRLLVNNSRWGNFRTRRTRRWHTLHPRPVALLGDAVHTAHFSVGSGTKMAMEDAVALARALTERPHDLKTALRAYDTSAQPTVRKIQDSARPSLAWWEHFGRYYDAFEPWQFAYHFFTRSLTNARLARRAPDFVEASHKAWASAQAVDGTDDPLRTPFTHAGWSTPERVVEIATVAGSADGPGEPFAVHMPKGRLPLFPTHGPLPMAGSTLDAPWGVRLPAPDREAGLADAFQALAALPARGPALVAVYGGTPLTRTLLCEQTRLQHGLPALLVDDSPDRDRAVTTVLSGRADLVGVPENSARSRDTPA